MNVTKGEGGAAAGGDEKKEGQPDPKDVYIK